MGAVSRRHPSPHEAGGHGPQGRVSDGEDFRRSPSVSGPILLFSGTFRATTTIPPGNFSSRYDSAIRVRVPFRIRVTHGAQGEKANRGGSDHAPSLQISVSFQAISHQFRFPLNRTPAVARLCRRFEATGSAACLAPSTKRIGAAGRSEGRGCSCSLRFHPTVERKRERSVASTSSSCHSGRSVLSCRERRVQSLTSSPCALLMDWSFLRRSSLSTALLKASSGSTKSSLTSLKRASFRSTMPYLPPTCMDDSI